MRPDLAREAIRPWPAARTRLMPQRGEIKGLLALMLLHERRRPRPGVRPPAAISCLLEQQDRALWDANQIAEGLALVETGAAVAGPARNPMRCRAAIAALHARAPSFWRYRLAADRGDFMRCCCGSARRR